jgi:hypothetical protein
VAAHVRLDMGEPVVVPLTLLPPEPAGPGA